MMANKEKLEQLRDYIKSLTALIEEISERDIYPVSFFSQAYDLTSTIQEELRQIEIAQIDLFEKQMKEHQAQILSFVPHQVQPETPKETSLPDSDVPPLPETENTTNQAQGDKHVESLNHTDSPAEPDASATELPSHIPLQQENVIPEEVPSGEINRIDLKKVITLNDRFLFCRELFSNDENLMNRTITDLNKTASLEASMDYINNHFSWNVEDDPVADFIACLKKSFGN